jgi:hypothetical protein
MSSVACIHLWSLHEQCHQLRGWRVAYLLYLLACIRTDLDGSGTTGKSNNKEKGKKHVPYSTVTLITLVLGKHQDLQEALQSSQPYTECCAHAEGLCVKHFQAA